MRFKGQSPGGVALLALALLACGRGTRAPDQAPDNAPLLIAAAPVSTEPVVPYPGFDPAVVAANPGGRFAAYLAQFRPEEDHLRLEFFNLKTDQERLAFCKQYGLVRRHSLSQMLRPGMTQSDVRRVLGDPNYAITHLEPTSPRWLYWEVENRPRIIYIYLQFRNYRLEGWGTFYPPMEQSHRVHHGLWEAEYDTSLAEPLLEVVNESGQQLRLVFTPYTTEAEIRTVVVKPYSTWQAPNSRLAQPIKGFAEGLWYYSLSTERDGDKDGEIDIASLHRYRLLYSDGQ